MEQQDIKDIITLLNQFLDEKNIESYLYLIKSTQLKNFGISSLQKDSYANILLRLLQVLGFFSF